MNLLMVITIAITATNYSYNPKDFYEDNGQLVQTGKFNGNAIVQMGEEYSCYDVHNVNSDVVQGDVNLDGTINIADIVLLSRFVDNGYILEQWGNGDFNGDGNINRQDIDDLESYILNL